MKLSRNNLLESHFDVIYNLGLNRLETTLICTDTMHIDEYFIEIQESINKFKSEWLVRKAYKRNSNFIQPQSVPIGSDSNCFQYVPISKTLKAISEHKEFRNIVMKPIAKSNVADYCSYQDGSRLKEANKFSSENSIVLNLKLYSDGLEITNPIGNTSAKHNCTMMYFTVLNLGPKFNSRLKKYPFCSECKH